MLTRIWRWLHFCGGTHFLHDWLLLEIYEIHSCGFIIHERCSRCARERYSSV